VVLPTRPAFAEHAGFDVDRIFEIEKEVKHT